MEMERNTEARVRADLIHVILGERAYGLIPQSTVENRP
jgi:hypothetical protein